MLAALVKIYDLPGQDVVLSHLDLDVILVRPWADRHKFGRQEYIIHKVIPLVDPDLEANPDRWNNPYFEVTEADTFEPNPITQEAMPTPVARRCRVRVDVSALTDEKFRAIYDVTEPTDPDIFSEDDFLIVSKAGVLDG